jgi:RNA polymerase sigma-70 factor (ECF subfamily)
MPSMTRGAMAAARRNLAARAPADARLRAFLVFVEARRDRAVRLAFRLLRGDAAAAEDVAQEAFIRAFRGLASFREDASLSTWFYRILVREAQRHRRRQSLRRLWSRDVAEAPEPIDETPDGDPGLRRRIRDALEGLTASQREAFVLVHLEGFTIAETAAILGKATGTVKSHIHRALESLRGALADLRASSSSARRETGEHR